MRKVAVFDTNILFSGVGWKGTPFLCIELARAGVVDGVTCRELLDELAEKLQSKLGFTPEQTLDTVADLLTFLRSRSHQRPAQGRSGRPRRRQGLGMCGDGRGNPRRHRRPPPSTAAGNISRDTHCHGRRFPRPGDRTMR